MEIQRSGSNNLDRSGDHCIFYRNRKETGAGKEPERETIPRLFTICSAMLRIRDQGSIPHPLHDDMADPDVCADRGTVQPDVVDLHLHTGETETGLFHVDEDGGRHGDPGVLLCESFA